MFTRLRPTLRYMMETEVHVYAFSMAANVLLSLFPFLIVMVSICKYILHWDAAVDAIYLGIRDYFPGSIGDFIPRNLERVVGRHGPLQFTSIFLLLFTANGIFEPLEVALNRAWGIKENRSFVRNQLISMGLILFCGAVAFSSTLLTALNQQIFTAIGLAKTHVLVWMSLAIFKSVSIPLNIAALFLVYWILPNGKVPARKLIPVSIAVGVILEVLKYVNLVAGPYLSKKLDKEYGPFEYPVTIILWSFVASMIVLAGADWAARDAEETDGFITIDITGDIRADNGARNSVEAGPAEAPKVADCASAPSTDTV